jgi:hypothetical protein
MSGTIQVFTVATATAGAVMVTSALSFAILASGPLEDSGSCGQAEDLEHPPVRCGRQLRRWLRREEMTQLGRGKERESMGESREEDGAMRRTWKREWTRSEGTADLLGKPVECSLDHPNCSDRRI